MTELSLRWLGVAGLEITVADAVLLVDPYLSRLPFHWMFRQLRLDPTAVAAHIHHATYLLVTHSHYDHLLDAPEVVHLTGAPLYGSPNTCRLAEALGVSENKTHLVDYGDRLRLAPFDINLYPARHIPMPFFGPGRLRRRLKPPFSVFGYRMDTNFCLDIRVAGLRLVTDPGLTPEVRGPVDILFMYPFRDENTLRQMLLDLAPRWAIPVHWDDFWRPLEHPLRPSRMTSLKRVNLPQLTRQVLAALPGVQVLVPDPLVSYDLASLLHRV